MAAGDARHFVGERRITVLPLGDDMAVGADILAAHAGGAFFLVDRFCSHRDSPFRA